MDSQIERELRSVADILHAVFMSFRENIWSENVSSVDIDDDSLVAHIGTGNISKQYFTDFPHHLVAANEQAKRALLTADACDEAYACLTVLIQKLLENIRVDFDIVEVNLGEVPYTVTTVSAAAPRAKRPGARHKVLRIDSYASRGKWIIDLAGPQMGINETLYTFSDYMASFVKKKDGRYRYHDYTYQVVAQYGLDFHKDLQIQYAAIWGIFELKIGLPMLAGEILQEAVNTWEQEYRRDVSTLPSLHEDAFPMLIQSLLYYLDKAVRSFKKDNDFSARVKAAMEVEQSYPGRSDRIANAIFQKSGPKYPDPTDIPVEPKGKQLLYPQNWPRST